MTTNQNPVGVAPTAHTDGNTALASLGIDFNRRNRGRRFSLDLSEATVIQICEAYQTMKRKASPRYSLQGPIGILRDMAEYARIQAETSIPRKTWGGPYMPEDIDDEFWVDFEIYIVNVPGKNGLRRHSSTAETYANGIIKALKWATTYGATPHEMFTEKKFGKYEKAKMALTDDQVSLIYHYDIDGKENRKKIRALAEEMKLTRFSFAQLKKVKDHFVFNCSSGQRISDSKRMTKANFTSTMVYEVTQQKTGNHARVDLRKTAVDLDTVEGILTEYDYTAPAFGMDTNVYNKLLKLLCRAIGGPFNKTISWAYKVGGEVIWESCPIWKAISSHWARRKFATDRAEDGDNMLEIQSQTGHSDMRSLSKYYAPNRKR